MLKMGAQHGPLEGIHMRVALEMSKGIHMHVPLSVHTSHVFGPRRWAYGLRRRAAVSPPRLSEHPSRVFGPRRWAYGLRRRAAVSPPCGL